jgi:hypothetical protein
MPAPVITLGVFARLKIGTEDIVVCCFQPSIDTVLELLATTDHTPNVVGMPVQAPAVFHNRQLTFSKHSIVGASRQNCQWSDWR